MALLDDAFQQIVGRERRERVSQLAWCGEGCCDSRRRVNSTVRHLPWRSNATQALNAIAPTSNLRCVRKPSAKLQIIQTSLGQRNQSNWRRENGFPQQRSGACHELL